jgi:hypothetical protein
LGVAYFIERQVSGISQQLEQQLEKLSDYARGAKDAILSRVPWSQKDDE